MALDIREIQCDKLQVIRLVTSGDNSMLVICTWSRLSTGSGPDLDAYVINWPKQ